MLPAPSYRPVWGPDPTHGQEVTKSIGPRNLSPEPWEPSPSHFLPGQCRNAGEAKQVTPNLGSIQHWNRNRGATGCSMLSRSSGFPFAPHNCKSWFAQPFVMACADRYQHLKSLQIVSRLNGVCQRSWNIPSSIRTFVKGKPESCNQPCPPSFPIEKDEHDHSLCSIPVLAGCLFSWTSLRVKLAFTRVLKNVYINPFL